ncbi:PYGO2 protein, partial [Neopipo cinnamomea]|nr:PYGO2 protein [Neopipo cinnamomea]
APGPGWVEGVGVPPAPADAAPLVPAGLQMKSPEKKRRKSNTQGPAYSHLSEFAPPPTPMVDHLVASNPFEDDFGAPKVGAAPAPFLGSPVPFGGFRVQGGGMSPQVPPGYGGGPQPLRRQPPPFGPGQMGPAFSMAPQNPNYVQGGGLGFAGQPFSQPLGQNFSPPMGQLMQGPVAGFGPMISPTMGQPPRGGGDMGPGPALNPPGGGPAVAQRFSQPGNLFGQSPLQRPGPNMPPLPPTASPFPGADPTFPAGGEEGGGKNPPPSTFAPEQHSGSPAAVNGAQPGFAPGSAARGSGTPDTNSLPLPPPGKAPGAPSSHQPPPGLVYPCGACRNEVNDDQDAILCEASCQKWFHRECTGMTENAYGLLTTEASAVWACDFCLKTKEIQSVYIREGMGQLVAANDG